MQVADIYQEFLPQNSGYDFGYLKKEHLGLLCFITILSSFKEALSCG